MNYPSGEHISFLAGELPSLKASQARLQAALPLPREIISAYGPALTREYALGNPEFDRKEAYDLQWAVAKSVDELTLSTAALVQTAEPAGNLSFFLAAPNLEVYAEIYRSTQQASGAGINAHGVQTHLYSLEHIFYYGQNPEPAYDTFHVNKILADKANRTYEQLVEQGLIDTSARRLNKRFGLMERTAQLAMIELLAQDLDKVRLVNEKWHDIATLTLQTLLEIDGKPPTIYNRLDAAKRMSEEWQEHSENEEHPIIKQTIGNIATHAAVIAGSVNRRMDYFATIYDAFGYKPPFSKLLEESQGTSRFRSAEAPTKAAPSVEQQRELDLKAEQERAQAEYNREIAREIAPFYRTKIEAFNKPWSISQKEFRGGDYQLFRQALTGNHGKFPLQTEAALTKTDARYVIGYLAKLQTFLNGGASAPVRDFLEASCLEEPALIRYANDTNETLRHDAGYEPIELPRKLTLYTQIITKHWLTFEPIIRELWPNNGADLAVKLDAFFDAINPKFSHIRKAKAAGQAPASEQSEASEPPAPAQLESDNKVSDAEVRAAERDLEKLIAEAEELDIVVFPDKPTDKEVTRVLREQGIKAHSLTPDRLARVREFLELRGVFDDCKTYVSHAGVKSSRRRYLVLRFTIDGKQYALAESLDLGRATYALAEHLADGTIIDILQAYKKDAQALGARAIGHTPDDTRHHEKLLNTVLTMHEETKGQAGTH